MAALHPVVPNCTRANACWYVLLRAGVQPGDCMHGTSRCRIRTVHLRVLLTPSATDKLLSACEGGAEVESLYLTACMHLGRANELDACSAAALNNWGASLSKFSRCKGRDEALPLLQESIIKHRSCAAIEPSNAEYTCNLADTVAEMAAPLSGPASDTLYQEAYGMWEQVLQQLQGTANLTDRCDATVNYGNALAAHAARLSDEGNRCVFYGAAMQLAIRLFVAPFD